MKRILVIDDEELILNFLKDLLVAEGYEVITACNGEEGLALFEEQSADLVITDIIMPVKDGLDTILELKKKAPELPVIAISAGGNIPKERYLAVAGYMKNTRTLATTMSIIKNGTYNNRPIWKAVFTSLIIKEGIRTEIGMSAIFFGFSNLAILTNNPRSFSLVCLNMNSLKGAAAF